MPKPDTSTSTKLQHCIRRSAMLGDVVVSGKPAETSSRRNRMPPHYSRLKRPTRGTVPPDNQQVREHRTPGHDDDPHQNHRYDEVSGSLPNGATVDERRGHFVIYGFDKISGLVSSGSVVDIGASRALEAYDTAGGHNRVAAIKVDRTEQTERPHQRETVSATAKQLAQKVAPLSVKPAVAVTILSLDNCDRRSSRETSHHSTTINNASRPRKLTSKQTPIIMNEIVKSPRRNSVDFPFMMTSSPKHNHAISGRNQRSMSLSVEASVTDIDNILKLGTRPLVKVTAAGYDRTAGDNEAVFTRSHRRRHSDKTMENRQIQNTESRVTNRNTLVVNSATDGTSGGDPTAVSPSDIIRMEVCPSTSDQFNGRFDDVSGRSHMTAFTAHQRLLRQLQAAAVPTTSGSRKQAAPLDSSATADLVTSSLSNASASTARNVDILKQSPTGLAIRYTRQSSDRALMLVPTSGNVERDSVSGYVTRVSSAKIVNFDSMVERRLYFIDNVPCVPPPSPAH